MMINFVPIFNNYVLPAAKMFVNQFFDHPSGSNVSMISVMVGVIPYDITHTRRVDFSLLGCVPGVLTIGALFDYNCLYFEDICGVPGSCLATDVWATAKALTGTVLGIKLFSQIFIVSAYCLYKPSTNQPHEAIPSA